ncbi:MAG: peptidase M42, partial [Kurthia sp.]
MNIFNEQQTVELLKRLTCTPSPTGYTKKIMNVMASILDQLGVTYTTTNKGAIIVTIKGSNDERHRLLTAHTDTLGAMVKEVKSSGRLSLSMVGGFNWNAVEGEYCTIHTASGE